MNEWMDGWMDVECNRTEGRILMNHSWPLMFFQFLQ